MQRTGLYCFLFVFSTFVYADAELKIISLQHRFPQDVLPAVQSLVGDNGSASAVQNNLLIRTTPEKMLQIEELIARLDTEQKNLRITVSHNAVVRQQNQHIGVSGDNSNGEGIIDLTSSRPTGGLDINQQQSDISRKGSEFVTVLDGQRAFIRVGQSVPFTQQWVNLIHHYPTMQNGLVEINEYRDITTGFAVRPRSIGNSVELEIVPRISRVNAAGYVDFEELSTIVRVKAGQWFDLGATMQGRDEVSRTILSRSASSQNESSRLMIKVD